MPSLDAETLIDQARNARLSATEAKATIGLLDLTSLTGTEQDDDIKTLCDNALRHDVAAVCVYPVCLKRAKSFLGKTDIQLAAVTNFPDGSDDIARAMDESREAVSLGAQEIDLVAPIQSIMEGDVGLVGEMVEAVRSVIGNRLKLKIILETGVLETPDRITAAARSAVMAGVDMLKTSTGKAEKGASLEAALTLLSVIRESGGRVGLKISGGVRKADDAAGYLHLARSMMGEGWINADHLRIGASSLLDDLVQRARS